MSLELDGVVVAVDVGGTTIKGGLVDAAGRTLATVDRPTPSRSPDETVAMVRGVVDELTERAAGRVLRAVGLAVPGTVDPVAGVARYSANLGWRDVPVAALAGTTVDGVPLVLDHDVRSAAVAERTFGAARGVDESCVIVVGTGIAAVSVRGGREQRGARGMAGELGHVPVWPDGDACPCGQRGCLEAYASAGAIARRYAGATGRDVRTEDVVAAIGTDPVAARVWGDAIVALATALVTVTMLDDPEVLVLAGGLSEAGPALVEPLRAAMAERLTWRSAPRLEYSALGARAGRYGIAVLAWQAAGCGTFDAWTQGALAGAR